MQCPHEHNSKSGENARDDPELKSASHQVFCRVNSTQSKPARARHEQVCTDATHFVFKRQESNALRSCQVHGKHRAQRRKNCSKSWRCRCPFQIHTEQGQHKHDGTTYRDSLVRWELHTLSHFVGASPDLESKGVGSLAEVDTRIETRTVSSRRDCVQP